MLTAALIVLCPLLAVALGVVVLFWRAAALRIHDVEELLRDRMAELDALSIAAPRVDTATGSHDALPIQPDIRRMLTDYCEGMWQHTTQEKR